MSAMKQRGLKMNAVQHEYLIDYMCTNPNFAAGRFIGPMGHESSAKTWAMLMHDLNLKGPEKTVEQWKKVWTDVKSKTRSKVGEIRAAHNRTGNIVCDGDVPLSDSDKKVIAIIGEAGVEGLRAVADSLPDSVKCLRKLMNGDQIGLSDAAEEFAISEMCAAKYELENTENVRRKREIEPTAGPSSISTGVQAAGPLNRPTSAEKKNYSKIKRDGRFLEILEERTRVMETIASNGDRLNQLLGEIVAIQRRKLELMEAAEATK